MLRTIGSRLTALAAGITLVVSFLVCTALYFGIRQSLYQEVDTFLAGEVAEFRAILAATGDDFEEVQRRIRNEVGSRYRRDMTFRLLDAEGHVLLTSDPSHRLPEPWPLAGRHDSQMLFRTESAPAANTRTASQWVEFNGETRIVQTTYLLDQVSASLNRFLRICAASLATAFVLAWAGGRVLARRALQPIAKMVASARKIGVENLAQRLERTRLHDELDELAATFNDMFGRLENQVAQLRQFTADAAHELRTPLAALRGNAELLLSGDRSSDELRSGVAEAIEEYDRLARIADDLLLLARADAGQEFIRRSSMRLDVAVEDVVDLFAPLADERGVGLRCSSACELPMIGDDGRLRQMIGNLIDNAIKYAPAGGRVEVTLGIVDGAAELAVSDTGAGIPPEHLPHVFNRFYRADRARTRDGGAGLGLAISRTIVQGHAGTINLSSEHGKGTTVRVMLPLSPSTNSQ